MLLVRGGRWVACQQFVDVERHICASRFCTRDGIMISFPLGVRPGSVTSKTTGAGCEYRTVSTAAHDAGSRQTDTRAWAKRGLSARVRCAVSLCKVSSTARNVTLRLLSLFAPSLLPSFLLSWSRARSLSLCTREVKDAKHKKRHAPHPPKSTKFFSVTLLHMSQSVRCVCLVG